MHPVVRRGQEDSRLEERRANLLHRPLAAQEIDQRLRLAVGEDQGVVVSGAPAVVLDPGPGAGVALDVTGAALDLDQEEALGRQDEGVDLVDRAVAGDELEV
jgi:hypothetical protein